MDLTRMKALQLAANSLQEALLLLAESAVDVMDCADESENMKDICRDMILCGTDIASESKRIHQMKHIRDGRECWNLIHKIVNEE